MRVRPASGEVCGVSITFGGEQGGGVEGSINEELLYRVLPEWGMPIHSAAKKGTLN